MGFEVAEVPVVWAHAEGTRINPVADGAKMVMEMLRIRWYALTGKYGDPPVTTTSGVLAQGPGPRG
jgi:hypothetical protein